MDGMILGFDLCDTYTRIAISDTEETWVIPTVVCKDKNNDNWYIDEEAYEHVLAGDGVVEDKLLSLIMKDGTATIEGVRYDALDLLKNFLKKAIETAAKKTGTDVIDAICFAIREPEAKIMDSLMYCADFLGISRQKVHIISHTESFVYYVMSQKRDVWSNQVGLFDLSDGSLRYYEMKTRKGFRQLQVLADNERQEESFRLDVLDTKSGSRMADKILSTCADRLLQKRLFSAIILTGKGFETTDWATDFIRTVSFRRRVFQEHSLFALGAYYKAIDTTREKTSYGFTCICDSRLKTGVSLKVLSRDKEVEVPLANTGDNWYEAKSTVNLIVDGDNEIEFYMMPMDQKNKKSVKIMLEGFPHRPDRTTKVELTYGFLDDKTMAVIIRDKGFGEIFPSSGTVIRREVTLA